MFISYLSPCLLRIFSNSLKVGCDQNLIFSCRFSKKNRHQLIFTVHSIYEHLIIDIEMVHCEVKSPQIVHY